jgi:signal peptidase II
MNNMFVKGLILAIIVLVLDQWSKFYIFNLLDSQNTQVIDILPFFRLVKVYNYGVSFGMFNDLAYGKLILSSVASIITIILGVWLYRVKDWYMAVALGLIIGGAVGNIIDRVSMGAVADFLDFYIGAYHWPAFNVADIAVVVGVGILLLDSFFKKDDKDEKADN